MKKYLGILIVLVGCILLILHAVLHLGNYMLYAGIGVEVVGIILEIILNKLS